MLLAMPSSIQFLPGALGRRDIWRPVAERLTYPANHVHVAWPGFDGAPLDPAVGSVDDLAARVAGSITGPTALVAQSMGGIVAVLAALRRPAYVTHLVLSVTSGGIDMRGLGAQDWRAAVRAEHPHLPHWFLEAHTDLTPRLAALGMPTLLLWGDADPISPVAMGERLAALLPRARLHVVEGGGHDLASAHADEVAPLIDAHLAA